MSNKRAGRGLLLLSLTAALASCAPVGPNFEHPAASAGAYLPGSPPGVITATIGDAWWTAFGSPAIDATVERALRNNASLVELDAALARADALAGAAEGRLKPQIDASARIDRERVNLASYGFSGPSPTITLYSIGPSVRFPLDVFGGERRRIEAARARVEVAQRRLDTAKLSIAGNVVVEALTIAQLRREIATTQALIGESNSNADLAEKARRAGSGTMVNVVRAQSQVAADQSTLPALTQRLAESRHRLALLVGETSGDWTPPDFDLAAIHLPAAAPLTVSSALAHNRPDILQAEAELHAATAEIGVATAQLYPDIAIGASVLQGASGVGSLFGGMASGWDVFAGLTTPIFHGGTLKAQRQAAVEQARASAAAYRGVVLSAFQQVADLLTAAANDRDAIASASRAADLATRAYGLQHRSFEVGNSGFVDVLDAQRANERARLDLVRTQAAQLQHVAQLYAATAGSLAPQTTALSSGTQ